MATEDEVGKFLKEFKQKLKIWGIYFRDDRGKNTQTLADLEILSVEREKIIEQLNTEDYCEGPVTDELYKGADLWVFGKQLKDQEVYIKITMGIPNNRVICISFHISKYKLSYPFKK
jgi:hypothetical protein